MPSGCGRRPRSSPPSPAPTRARSGEAPVTAASARAVSRAWRPSERPAERMPPRRDRRTRGTPRACRSACAARAASAASGGPAAHAGGQCAALEAVPPEGAWFEAGRCRAGLHDAADRLQREWRSPDTRWGRGFARGGRGGAPRSAGRVARFRCRRPWGGGRRGGGPCAIGRWRGPGRARCCRSSPLTKSRWFTGRTVCCVGKAFSDTTCCGSERNSRFRQRAGRQGDPHSGGLRALCLRQIKHEAALGRGEADDQQGAVAQAAQVVGDRREQRAEEASVAAVTLRGVSPAAAVARRMPARVSATRGSSVGGGRPAARWRARRGGARGLAPPARGRARRQGRRRGRRAMPAGHAPDTRRTKRAPRDGGRCGCRGRGEAPERLGRGVVRRASRRRSGARPAAGVSGETPPGRARSGR
jgi:hypothetical protein